MGMKGKVRIRYVRREDGTFTAQLSFPADSSWHTYYYADGATIEEARQKVIEKFKDIPETEEMEID
jgi:hypothetical protein